MNGRVFQSHSERKNKAQFADTMEALRIYSSLVYKDDIELLIVLFTEPGKPEVKKPPGPKEEMKTDAKWNITKGSDGALIMTVSTSEEAIHNERIKQ